MAGDIHLHADVQGAPNPPHNLRKVCPWEGVLKGNELTKLRNAPGMVLHKRVVGDDWTPSITKRTIQLKSGKTIDADVSTAFASWLAGKYWATLTARLTDGMVLQNHKTLQCTAELHFAVCGDIITRRVVCLSQKQKLRSRRSRRMLCSSPRGPASTRKAPFTDHEYRRFWTWLPHRHHVG